MTWRSIESDPPKMGQKLWLATSERRYEWAIEWSLPWRKSTWTHWSPCEPPADLPPRPRTAFEEWVYERDTDLGNGLVWVPLQRHSTCTHIDVCRVIFEAGYEAGKAKG